MLLFRSEEHIERWCRSWRLPLGAILTMEQLWKLADAWYCDRMSAEWQRRTIEQAHALFASLGLTSQFWRFC
jgi:hypothetical protein